MIPKVFGFPLWYGKIKNRRAKKYLNFLGSPMNALKSIPQFSAMKIGSVVNTCDGFNHKIYDIIPEYFQVGKGFCLVGIDLVINERGGMCSLGHCGINVANNRETIESSYLSFIEDWLFGESGKTWYGGLDNPKYQAEIQRLIKRHDALKNGHHICDENGFLLEEYRS